MGGVRLCYPLCSSWQTCGTKLGEEAKVVASVVCVVEGESRRKGSNGADRTVGVEKRAGLGTAARACKTQLHDAQQLEIAMHQPAAGAAAPCRNRTLKPGRPQHSYSLTGLAIGQQSRE